MDISQRGIDLIKDYESFSAKAYLCPEKVPTIGWGSIRWAPNKPVKMGDACTVEQAEDLLRKEVILIEDAIDSSVKVPLTQGQFDCLCSWGYNVGTGWINGKRKGGAATLIKYLNKGQYDKVPSELLKFKKGAKSGKSYDGLLNRRKRELRELWFSNHGQERVVKPEKVVEPEAKLNVDLMPQDVVPDAPSMPAIAKESKTVQMSALGILATTFGQAWEWLFGVAKEAGPEVVTNQTALSPFNALLTTLGANVGLLAAIIAVGTLIVVIQRKVSSERA